MSEIKYADSINRDYYGKVERILFFNQQQGKYQQDIVEATMKYGEPVIVSDGSYMTVKIEGQPISGSIFALFGGIVPVGILTWMFDPPSDIRILHIAIEEKYGVDGIFADLRIVGGMVRHLKETALADPEIETISFSYKHKRKLRLRREHKG